MKEKKKPTEEEKRAIFQIAKFVFDECVQPLVELVEDFANE